MKTVKVELECQVEDLGATDYEIREYVEFMFGGRAQMSASNPYIHEGEPEVHEISVDVNPW